jgi:hypothetical protein
MTVPIVAVIARAMNKNIANLIEAKNSTTSRENSSHPRPEGRDVSRSERASGLFIEWVLAVVPRIGTYYPFSETNVHSLEPAELSPERSATMGVGVAEEESDTAQR